MTIEKNGNKWRISEMRNGKRYRVSVDYEPTKKQARQLIDEKIKTNTVSNDLRDTFATSADKYIKIKYNVLSPSTIRAYYSMLSNMSDGFKRRKTADITQEDVQKEINDYTVGHSPKSTANLHGFISAILGIYRPNLILHTTLPQKVKFEAVTPSEDTIKRLLSEIKGTDFEIAFRLGVYGLRRGEICALTSDDLEGNLLSINKSKVRDEHGQWIIKPIPKTTGSQRTIYIDDDLADLLRAAGDAYPKNPNKLNQKLTSILTALGVPVFRFHDLRAYYASMAHALGIPDAYIMANGGWTSTNILNRVYKRTFAEMQAETNKTISEHLTF